MRGARRTTARCTSNGRIALRVALETADPSSWDATTREYWRALIETHGDRPNTVTLHPRPGRLPATPEAASLTALKAAAAEIGELGILRVAGSAVWRRP